MTSDKNKPQLEDDNPQVDNNVTEAKQYVGVEGNSTGSDALIEEEKKKSTDAVINNSSNEYNETTVKNLNPTITILDETTSSSNMQFADFGNKLNLQQTESYKDETFSPENLQLNKKA